MREEELSAAARAFIAKEPGWFTLPEVRRRLRMVGSSVVYKMNKVLNSTQRMRLDLGSDPELQAELVASFRLAYPFEAEKLQGNELFQADKFYFLSAFKRVLTANAKGVSRQMRTMVTTIGEYYTTPRTLDQLAVFLRYALAAKHGTTLAHLEGIATAEVYPTPKEEDDDLRPFSVPAPGITRDELYVPPIYDPPLFTSGVYDARYATIAALQVQNAEQAELVCYSYHPVIKAVLELAESSNDVHLRLLGGREGRLTSVRALLQETLNKVAAGIDTFDKFVAESNESKNWKSYREFVDFTMAEFVSERDIPGFQLYIEEVVDEVAYATTADRIEQIGFVLALAGVALFGGGLGGTILAGVLAGAGTTADLVATVARYAQEKEMTSANRAALVDTRLKVAPETGNPELNLLFGISALVVSDLGGELAGKLASRSARQVVNPFQTPRQRGAGGQGAARPAGARSTDAGKPNKSERSTKPDRSTAEVKGTQSSRDTRVERGTDTRLSGHKNDIDLEVDADVERSFDEMQVGGSKKHPVTAESLPPTVPDDVLAAAEKQFEQARNNFENRLRNKFAKALSLELGMGGQVHHSIELDVLQRYPNAFTAAELNALPNMRGILPERTTADMMDPRYGRKQFHGSKLREVWSKGYADLDRKIREKLADPNSNFKQDLSPNSDYNRFIRDELTKIRDSIDRNYNQFFSQKRTQFDFSKPAMLKHDRATLDKATGKKIAEDLPPKDRQ